MVPTRSRAADYSDKTAAVVLTLNGSTNATASVGGADGRHGQQHRERNRRIQANDTLTGNSAEQTALSGVQRATTC